MPYNSREKTCKLENLKREIEKDPENLNLWYSIYEIYMDIGCYEGALECCDEILRLKPDCKELYHKQKYIKKMINKVSKFKNHSNSSEKKREQHNKSGNKPKKTKKSKAKSASEAKKTHYVIDELKINITKECPKEYTPNTKYQLRHDADKNRKYSKW